MITSKHGFYERFIAKKVGQRMQFRALRRSMFWLDNDPENAAEYGIQPGDTTFEVNGILLTCWRKPETESYWGMDDRPAPMHKIKLELRDVLINGVPMFGRRRKSRKARKQPYCFRIALSDICWPDSAAGGICLGIAGFLASGFPAPDTPPEEQKAQAPYGDRGAPSRLTARPLESGGGQVAQDDPNAVWNAKAKAKTWFKAVKKGLRRGDPRAQAHRKMYDEAVRALSAGVKYSEILNILAPAWLEKQ